MTQTQVAYAAHKENVRHNQAVEGETKRSNLISESETARRNRATEAIQWETLRETTRSNRAREYETWRSNVAKQQEINRSNVAKEAETRRSNQANEAISLQNAETNRLNANTNVLNYRQRVQEHDDDMLYKSLTYAGDKAAQFIGMYVGSRGNSTNNRRTGRRVDVPTNDTGVPTVLPTKEQARQIREIITQKGSNLNG